MREISNSGIDFLSKLEGAERYVYLDSAGLATIGVGHLLTRSELTSGKIKINGDYVKYKDGLSYDQIGSLLKQDLDPVVNTVNNAVKVKLTQNQFEALVSFTYNVGKSAFENSTLLRLLNEGEYDQVSIQLVRWIRAGGRVVNGLINRRHAEIELWNKK